MTSVHTDLTRPRSEDERWEEWRARYASASRRSGTQMTWVVIGIAVALAVWLLRVLP